MVEKEYMAAIETQRSAFFQDFEQALLTLPNR
jgi:hypothetical protein